MDYDFADGYAACHFTSGIDYENSGTTACSLLITIPIIAAFLYAAPFHTFVVLLIVLAARTKHTDAKQSHAVENTHEPIAPQENVVAPIQTEEPDKNGVVRPNVLDGMV